MIPHSSTNLRNRVNKLYLPKTKPLYPLFEIISNSIHAIHERKKEIGDDFIGLIIIRAIRNGREETIKEISDIEEYPINSFDIIDNGIGLNDANLRSFAEFDSEKKAEIGGKGVGRLICLKAFNKLTFESTYRHNGNFKTRKFHYKKSKDGFDDYSDQISDKKSFSTQAILSSYEKKYEKFVPKSLMEIARQIVTHFQLYFIQGIEPKIIIKNQDDTEINLTKLFNSEFEKEILQDTFEISKQVFKIFISKSYKAQSHRIHYCAHERTVKDEGLSKYLEDLKYKIRNEEYEEGFYFQVFVVGDYLNKNVNEARTSFYFSTEEDDEEIDYEEITLSKIRRASIQSIENLLSEFLQKVRKDKLDGYFPIIREEFPNYSSVINYNMEKVKKLPIGLSKHELDLKLYEIESEWKLEVKKEGLNLLNRDKDITQLEDYKKLYDKFLTEFNEIGQSELARYVVHRRSVIDLLEKLIELNQDNKFANEDIVHSLFFPIKETSNTVISEKQNLWLLDERLTFNSLLASDKLFKQVEELKSDSAKRMDLIVKQGEVFENATLFSENKYPFESFTIVEFKRPERDDYKQGDRKKDPVKQVRSYIQEIVSGKEKIKGKRVEANKNTPFYCYIIADRTPSLEEIMEYESFIPTPDGLGYFRFYQTNNSTAYIEVLPFQKIIKDAKQRNKILFDSLKLS